MLGNTDFMCDQHRTENCTKLECIQRYRGPMLEDSRRRLVVLRQIHARWMKPTTAVADRRGLKKAVDRMYRSATQLLR